MATSASLLAFFSRMKSQDGIIVEEQPRLDLDLYIQNYEGRTRFDRLLLVGKTSVTLCVDALKAAVIEAKKGRDVGRYREAWDNIRIVAPDEPEAQRDDSWIEQTDHANQVESDRLEMELKGYKNNLIKESIRMGNEDLGVHYEAIGYLKDAAEAYSRMRHDAGTHKHIMDCAQHLVSVSLQRRDWSAALSNVGKITGFNHAEEEKNMQPYIKIVAGISNLGLGKYRDAASCFLEASASVPANTFSDVASPNDVAIYGGLLALATMDRYDLQKLVLDNTEFRGFLENEPNIRKAITFFVNGRFSSCLAILETVRPDCLLDIYLQRHVHTIFNRIRSKCITQYFVPFSRVTIESLEAAFGQDGTSIEQELVGMIRSGALNAKIDSKAKLLIAVDSDQRLEMQHAALDSARRFEQEGKERLRRINLITAGLEVFNPKKQSEDSWYDQERRASMQEMTFAQFSES